MKRMWRKFMASRWPARLWMSALLAVYYQGMRLVFDYVWYMT